MRLSMFWQVEGFIESDIESVITTTTSDDEIMYYSLSEDGFPRLVVSGSPK